MKTTEAQLRAIAKYDAANMKKYLLKLNRKTDSDVIDRLEQVENRQGYIKALIRKDIAEGKK